MGKNKTAFAEKIFEDFYFEAQKRYYRNIDRSLRYEYLRDSWVDHDLGLKSPSLNFNKRLHTGLATPALVALSENLPAPMFSTKEDYDKSVACVREDPFALFAPTTAEIILDLYYEGSPEAAKKIKIIFSSFLDGRGKRLQRGKSLLREIINLIEKDQKDFKSILNARGNTMTRKIHHAETLREWETMKTVNKEYRKVARDYGFDLKMCSEQFFKYATERLLELRNKLHGNEDEAFLHYGASILLIPKAREPLKKFIVREHPEVEKYFKKTYGKISSQA